MKTSIFEEINIALKTDLKPYEIIKLGILEEYCKLLNIGINDIELRIEEAVFYKKTIENSWINYERYGKETSDWFVFKYGNFFDWHLIIENKKNLLTEENIIKYFDYLDEITIIILIEHHIIDLEFLKKLLDLKKDFRWEYVKFGIGLSLDNSIYDIKEFLKELNL